jgi:uncharacterized protein YraI
MYHVHRFYKHFISTVFIIAIIGIFALAVTAWATGSGVINSSVVNVRSGPGTGYAIAGTILKNTQVQILQTQGSWDKIQFGSLTGWVSSSLITASQSTTSTPTTVTSAPSTTVITTTPPRVLLDGKELRFEVSPVIENSRTLVPLRTIFEAMGATVQWNQSMQTVTATKGSKTVVLPLNSTSPTINGVVYPLDTAAKIVNDRTLAPLRFVGEAFDGTVSWDAAARTIFISSSQTDATPTQPAQPDSSIKLSSSRDENGVKIIMQSEVALSPEISQSSGQVVYAIKGRQISGTNYIKQALGSDTMTVQAASDTNGTAITFTLPAQIKYNTLSQDNGKTLIFFVTNYIINQQTADNVTQEYIVNNRPGTELNPTGQVVHATADPGATAQNIHDYFNNHPDAEASTHAVIDWNSIIEMIPENEKAWHAGPTANSHYLSFEMCEPATDDPDRNNKFQEVWNRAVWYCAKTCVKYGWNTNENIFSHNGISKTYHETNHTDPYGYFAAYGKTWDQFLADVDAEIAVLWK